MVASSSLLLKIRHIAAMAMVLMGVHQAQAVSDSAHTVAVAAAAGGSGNCLGCFEATSGTCQLDVDKPGCLPATPSDCAALRLPYENNSATTWPEGGGCLARISAYCEDLLHKYNCDKHRFIHAANATDCAAKAKAYNMSYSAYMPSATNAYCMVIPGDFIAGCVCSNCEYYTYTELKSGETRNTCDYSTTRWSCVAGQCMPDRTGNGKPLGECEQSCGK